MTERLHHLQAMAAEANQEGHRNTGCREIHVLILLMRTERFQGEGPPLKAGPGLPWGQVGAGQSSPRAATVQGRAR